MSGPTIHSLGDLSFYLTKRYPAIDPDVLDVEINRRYTQILRYYTWSRLEVDDASIVTSAPYTIGLLTATNGSTSIVGDGTNAWTSPLTNGLSIRIAGRDEFYTVTFVDSNHLTLDHGFEGVSGSSLSYIIFQRIYQLANDCQVLHPVLKLLQTNAYIVPVSREDLDRMSPSRTETNSFPRVWAPYQDTSTGVQQIELYPSSPQAVGILYHYKTAKAELSAATDQIPSWFPWDALLMGCEVSLSKLSTPIVSRTVGIWAARQQQVNEAEFQQLLDQAVSMDSNLKPPEQLRMDTRFTDHRRERQFSDRAEHWLELHRSQ